jgi:hypothetical protein
MGDIDRFLPRLLAARRAAWLTFIIGVVLQLVVYGGYLGIERGWVDGLIQRGVYGELTRTQLAHVTLAYVALLKLMNTGILLGAVFLTLWVRGLRRLDPVPAT